MRPDDFTPDSPGRMVSVTSRLGEKGWAFVPDSLPPAIDLDADLVKRLEAATLALGRLDGLGRMLPNPHLLIRPFIRREALASSRIEGTRAEFDQLVLFEAAHDDGDVDPDVQEVANYVRALEIGWYRPPDRKISIGLVTELHQILLSGVRGATKGPGQLRTNLVLIGGPGDDVVRARFVPPPPTEIRGLLDGLASYFTMSNGLPALIKLALIHYQFEAIHPFFDGNGRMGRLLMPLFLGEWGLLKQPLLYLSQYFEERRDSYIDHLYAVSQRGAWREWILFVLDAVETQSVDAVQRGHALLQLREQFRSHYQSGNSGRTLQVIDRLLERPSITINEAATMADITHSGASRIVERLVKDGMLVEWTGQKRNRVYLAPEILTVISGNRIAGHPDDAAT